MLPTADPIGFDDVLTELQKTNPSRTNPVEFSDADVLALAGVPGPSCSFSDLYGKAVLQVTAPNVTVTSSTVSASGSSTATATGGDGAYTFSWVYLSGDSFTMAGNTTATCTFSHAVAAGDDFTGVYRVTVHDGHGNTASTDITVELRHS